MISRTTRKFRDHYKLLSAEVQLLAKQSYILFCADPHHPGLKFKKIQNSVLVSVRVGLHYRALGIMTGSDTVTWSWIGHHSEYDKIIG